MKKLVKDFYQINELVLEEMVDEKDSDYLKSSLSFYRSVKEKDLSMLSPKQITWLSKIEAQIKEELMR